MFRPTASTQTTLKALLSLVIGLSLGWSQLGSTWAHTPAAITPRNVRADITNSWLMNTTTYAPNFPTTLVNVQSVSQVSIGGVTYVRVQASGIPDYSTLITQNHINTLNSRPKGTDFVTSTTTTYVGQTVLFGQNIGYDGIPCALGYWPFGPQCPSNQAHDVYFPLTPSPSSITVETQGNAIGLWINGTGVFNWSDAMSYDGNDPGTEDDGIWENAASAFEVYDMDICPGHAQQQGLYHHHDYPACLAAQLGDTGTGHSPIYGFAADGYPIHGPWNAANTLAVSGWKTRDYSNGANSTGCPNRPANTRHCLLVDQYDISQGVTQLSASQHGPTTTINLTTESGNSISATSGIFFQDYYFDSACGSACLDSHNGHDHDGLGYHYHVTITGTNGVYTPAFPYIIGPTYYGTLHNTAMVYDYNLAVVKGGTGGGTVTSSPSGLSCGTTCGALFDAAETITLTATPSSTSAFTGWSGGNCTGTGTCTIQITQATTITATFAPLACYTEYTGDNVTDFSSADASAIQNALNAATAGGTVKVAGTCAGVQSGGQVPQIASFTKNLTLQGGYTTTNWLAAANSDTYPTILDANLGGRVAEIDSGKSVTLSHLYMAEGYAYAGGTLYSGGAVYNAGTVVVEYSTITGSKAYYGGGLHNVFSSGAKLTLRNSLVANNQATSKGGGLYAGETSGTAEVMNSTFSGNSAYWDGGAVGLGDGVVVTLTFATLTNNVADTNNNGGDGGGIGQYGTGRIYLKNTLIADNSDVTNTSNAADCVESSPSGTGGIYAYGYNLVEVNCGGIDTTGGASEQIGVSQSLSALADNGGPTLTHAISSGSNASNKIASGTNGCNSTYTVDQRGTGYARLQGTSPNNKCDIGAYEGP